jgi:hypothetical protein
MNMNLKATLELTVKQNENVYTFIMPAGAPIGEAYNAAFLPYISSGFCSSMHIVGSIL